MFKYKPKKAKITAPRVAVLLFPKIVSAEHVDDYLNGLRTLVKEEVCSSLKIMLSIPHDRHDLIEYATHSESVDSWNVPKANTPLVPSAFPLLASSTFEEIDYIIFVTGIIRYPIKICLEFIREAVKQNSNIMLGDPDLMHIDNRQSILRLVSYDVIAKGLMVDIATSKLLCSLEKTTLGHFKNLTPGLSAIRPHVAPGDRQVLTRIFQMGSKLWNNDLLVPYIVWCLTQGHPPIAGVKTIPVSDINLDPLRHHLNRRIEDFLFVLERVRSRAKLAHSNRELVNQLFDELGNFKEIFQEQYREWFLEHVLGEDHPDIVDRGKLSKKT